MSKSKQQPKQREELVRIEGVVVDVGVVRTTDGEYYRFPIARVFDQLKQGRKVVITVLGDESDA